MFSFFNSISSELSFGSRSGFLYGPGSWSSFFFGVWYWVFDVLEERVALSLGPGTWELRVRYWTLDFKSIVLICTIRCPTIPYPHYPKRDGPPSKALESNELKNKMLHPKKIIIINKTKQNIFFWLLQTHPKKKSNKMKWYNECI